MKKYDYIIVGAGLFGAVFAYEVNKKGKKCLVIDKRDHIGGNIYCENIEGINVHKYGAHIFHTNNINTWNYINSFTEFNNYIHTPIANYKGEIYNLPFNMNTFNKMWGIITPEDAKRKIEKEKKIIKSQIGMRTPNNLEEQALLLVGRDIYKKLIKGYTEKQWGKSPKELPSFIIKRLPVRFNYDNNYFNDKYQGIPINGYNKIIEKMLQNIEVKLNTDWFENKNKLKKISKNILFTGCIDEFYDYKYGNLEYRSLKFEHSIYDCDNYQGVSVINYTDKETPYTRIIEHKHFQNVENKKTVITKEYPYKWVRGKEPYYPVNDEKNNRIFNMYKELADKEDNIIFGGRLGDYKYYDMDKIIETALHISKLELLK